MVEDDSLSGIHARTHHQSDLNGNDVSGKTNSGK